MEGEVERLNAQLHSQAFTNSAKTQAAQFAATRKQAELLQRTYGQAAASTGLFDVSTRKIKSHTDEWVKNVQRQRLSLRDLMTDFQSYKNARNEQMRMQSMSISTFASDRNGNPLATVAMPRGAIKDSMTLKRELNFAAHAAESIGVQMINSGKNMQWAGRQLSMGFTAPLVAAGALSAKFAFDMDKQLTQTAKVYDTYATTQAGKEKELRNLRVDSLELSKQIAKEYGMAASDSLSIMAQLASAGQRGEALKRGTKETARFATLGDFDKDSAVKATNTLKSVFGIQKTELKEAVDFMNNIENSTSLTMQDMAEAIPTASAAVKNLNGNYKDMLILLTAMKERGFDPGESANALKAAGTRLIRPSKKVQAEFEGLTGESITEIRDRNQGDLIKTLLDVGNATKNLGTAQKQQARAALFGTEQAARLGGAMDGLIAAQTGAGQTAKAMEVSQLSAADNAKVAAAEMERQANSVSGKWTRAVETIKAQMFDMGIAFIKAGTTVLSVASDLIDMFQGLPSGAKKTLVWVAIIAAAAGPLLMLVGLSRNLGGQVIKLTAQIVKGLTPGIQLLTTEQTIAAKAADWANQKLAKETDTAAALTVQITALSNAFREAAVAQGLLVKAPPINPGATGNAYSNKAFAVGKDGTTTVPAARSGTAAVIPTHFGPKGTNMPKGTTNLGDVGAAAMATKQVAENEARAAKAAQLRNRVNLAGAGLFTAALVTQSVTSNKVANEIAKWAMVGGLVVPMINQMASGTGRLAKLAKFAMNPYVAAVAVVGTGIYMWYKHMKKVNKEIDDMYNDTDKIAKIFDLDPKGAGKVSDAQKATMSEAAKEQAKLNEEQEKSAKLADKMAAAYPTLIKRIKEANDPQEKYNLALMQGLKVIELGGGPEKARAAVKAALQAASNEAEANPIIIKYGVDFNNQKDVTKAAAKQVSDMSKDLIKQQREIDKANAVAKGNAVAANAGYGNNVATPEMKSQYKKIGTDLGSALKSGMMVDGAEGVKLFDNIDKSAVKLLNSIDGFDERKSFIDNLLKSYGATKNQRENALKVLQEDNQALKENISLTDILGAAGKRINPAVTARDKLGLNDYTAKDAQKYQKTYDSAFLQAAGTDAQKQKAGIAAVTAELTNATGESVKFKTFMDQVAYSIAGGITVMDALGVATGGATEKAAKLREAAKSIVSGATASATNTFIKNTSASMSQAHEAALANIDRSAEAASAAFDRRSQALEDRQTRRSQALDDRQERAQNAFEKRWAKKKKALDDEENLRKKIFEAEKTRIQRMKELNNDNVNYRVAVNTGNLDEAAKIAGEIDAKKKTYSLEDSDAAAAGKYDKAKGKLEDQEAREKKRLDRTFELQKRALERRNALEKRALDAQKAASEASVAIARDAENKKYAAQKNALDKGLAWIKAKNPQTQAELADLIGKAKKKFGIMGTDLEKNAKDWGNNMVDAMADRIKKAYKSITGQNYGKSGKQIADDFMRGMTGGKISTSQIIRYMETGKLPKSKSTDSSDKGNEARAGGRHEGGPVGLIKDGSRKGYSASNGVMPSEKMILAKKDEYVVDGKTHNKMGTQFFEDLKARHAGGPVGGEGLPGIAGQPTALFREGSEGIIKSYLTDATDAYKDAKEAAAKAAKAAALSGGADMGPVDPNGWNRPWKRAYGVQGGHDFPLPKGTPIYAPHSGIAKGHDIRGVETRRKHGGFGYRSYGRIMEVTGGGANISFAHMSTRAFNGPKKVKAGTFLGKSGETGNTDGAHVHMELNHRGDNSGVGAFFARHGVKLMTGGKTRYDTVAQLHARERVLDPENTRKLDDGIDRIATGDNGGYSVGELHIHVDGTHIDPNNIPALAKEIKKEFDKDDSRQSRKPKP